MYDQIVGSIYAKAKPAFDLAYPSLTLVLENQPFDWDNPPEFFVTLEVKFYSGEQIGMSEAPKTRSSGYVYVCVYVKPGLGSLSALAVLGFFANLLGYSSAGTVRFRAPEVDEPSKARGWSIQELKVPFYSDQG